MKTKLLKEELKLSCAKAALPILRCVANIGDSLIPPRVIEPKPKLTKQEIEGIVDQILADAGWDNLLATLNKELKNAD